MTSISDILQWIKKLFSDHNAYTNANSHADGFNHQLYLYPLNHGNPSYDPTVPAEAGLVFITSDNIPQLDGYTKTSFGAISFRANNAGTKIIPRLTIDYDELIDTTNNQRRQVIEYHFYGSDSQSGFVGGRMICVEPASVYETTSSNSYCKIALLCEDHAFHNVLTTYDLSTSSMMGFPDYVNRVRISRYPYTVPKNGWVSHFLNGDSLLQIRKSDGTFINAIPTNLYGEASQGSPLLPVKAGDIIKFTNLHGNDNGYFYPMR